MTDEKLLNANYLASGARREAAEREMLGALSRAPRGARLAVLMSGGADSTLCAWLAARAAPGQAIGITMRQTGDDSPARMAEAVCRELGIEHVVIDTREEFERHVAAPFRAACLRGETPNPCAACNRYVKLGALLDRAGEAIGEAVFATGHYAKAARAGGHATAARPRHRRKDQSYFLCAVPGRVFERLVFPLGDFLKSETREELRRLAEGMPAALAACGGEESMETCFSPGDVIREGRGPGPIISPDGAVIGRHRGIEHYTIGQRKGLGIASPEPLYVAAVLPGANAVVAAGRELAMTREVRAGEPNVLLPGALRDGARLLGKIRSQAEPAPCSVRLDDGGITALFDEPQFAPAPGQYLALYDGEMLAAGAVISENVLARRLEEIRVAGEVCRAE